MKGEARSVFVCVGLLLILLLSVFMPQHSFAMKIEKGRLYFVGVGPAGPDMATLQAIDVIKQVDVIFAPKYIQEPFHEYLKGKDVRVAWPESVYMIDGKPYTAVDSEENARRLGRAIAEHAAGLSMQFKEEMSQDKSVALLVNGDPCLFSDLRWFRQHFDTDQFEVIPGMSSFSAGAALFKVDLTQPRGLNTVIIHSPMAGVSEIRKLAKHKATMVFFMAGNLKMVVSELRKEYDKNTPISLAYFIGYPDKQKVIRGTLETIIAKTANEPEKEMLLIYVGNFMQ